MYIYKCSAVVRDMLHTDIVEAVSDKQAWYFFCKKNGFKSRDFKIIDRLDKASEQIKFNM